MARWFERIYFAVLENHGWSQVQDCDFVKWFQTNGVVFPHWYAVDHPSGPNYRCLLSGLTWSNNEFDGVWRPNIADHIPSAVANYQGAPADRHNPFLDMKSKKLTTPPDAKIIYYGMDDNNDAHSGPLNTADMNVMRLITWLGFPPTLAKPQSYREAFFLLFDEAFGVEYLSNHIFVAMYSPTMPQIKNDITQRRFTHTDF